MSEKSIKSHWLFSELSKQKQPFYKTIWLIVVNNLLQILISLFVMAVYNKVLPNYALSSLLTMAIGITIIIFIDFLLKIIKSRLTSNASNLVEETLQKLLFEKILSWDLDKRPSYAGASSTLLRDLENVIELFTNSSITTLVGLPFIVINILVIYLIAGPVAIAVLFIAVCAIIYSLYFYYKASNLSPENKATSIEKNSIFIEALSNLETLKSIGNYDYFTEKWQKADEQARRVGLKLKDLLADANSLNSMFQSFSQVLVVSVGAYFVIQGDITSGALIASVILNGKTIQPIIQLASLLQKISTAKSAFKKLDQTFNFVSKEEQRRANLELKEVNGPIKIENLTFQPENLNSPILTVKRLVIRKNQSVGIIGSVGSGKSTLLKLISGVFTPTEGSVCFGPFDTTAINQKTLRRDVAYLGQTPGIFAGTIRDNLLFGREDISDTALVEKMALTGFDLILKKFPNGLSFQLSENGSELSGGQKQILSLTRAIVSEPKIILLDEPTSAMDPKHEQLFIRQIQNFVSGRTFIVVTHRKPILALTERLIMVENGEIILDGPRDDVLAKFK